MRFAPNRHKKELRKELTRTEDELEQIEREIQDKINKKFEDVEVTKVARKFGRKAAQTAKEIKELRSDISKKKYRENRGEEKRRRKEEKKGT
jgi:hypothetical protein